MYVNRAKMRSTMKKGKLKKTFDALRTERTFESNLYTSCSWNSHSSEPYPQERLTTGQPDYYFKSYIDLLVFRDHEM